MPGWIGPGELLLLGIFVLLLFGPKRLPEIGRSLGQGFRELKDSLAGETEEAAPPAPTPLAAVGDAAFCHACGSPLAAGARFCSTCGDAVVSTPGAGVDSESEPAHPVAGSSD
jgi:sec-independent protein translocase protein TatA